MAISISAERLAEFHAVLDVARGPEYWSLDRAELCDAIAELLTEVERLRDENHDLRAVIADEHSRLSQELDARPDTCERCGGVPCSTCGECPRQGCWDCRCGQQDQDDNERDGGDDE